MSQSGLESRSKRAIHLESRVRTRSDPTLYSTKKKETDVLKLPFADTDIGQPCLKCGATECHGFMAHTWRKSCITCGCTKESHKVDQVKLLPEMQGFGGLDHQHLSVPERRVRSKYAWVPAEANPDLVEQYMKCLPKDFVPVRGSKGEQKRLKLFMTQLPAHDSGKLDACHKMAELDIKRMKKFVDRRKNKYFGVGEVGLELDGMACKKCNEPIGQGDVKVTATRVGGDHGWHPQCFKCSTCEELLVDLIYFYSPDEDKILCGRHHGETIVPRCTGCDELIFSNTYTESGEKKWHGEHFCCSVCDENVKGKLFREEDNMILCKKCFDKEKATKCYKCKEPISIKAHKMYFEGQSWHIECFHCKRCREDLREEKFFLIKGDLLCAECVDPIAQCCSCKSGISPVASYLQYNSRCWHAECFKCVICQAWLADGQFHEMDASLMCSACYVEKVGKKCDYCEKVIKGKGLQYGLKVYHQECFVCKKCKCLLSENTKTKERNGDPFCADCAQMLAMKCFKCQAPITTRHTVYKGHPFHLECFTCNKCGLSVAKSEFFESSLNEILCMKCAN